MNIAKRWKIIGISVVLSVIPSLGAAGVTGPCSNCHTMHNSQEGVAMAFSRNAAGTITATTVPYNRLLKTDCVGCHTHTGSDTIVTIGTTRIPIVYNTVQPTYPPNGSSSSVLAGGNFYWVAQPQGDRFGHNVHGISNSDVALTTAPGTHASCGGGAGDCHKSLANSATGCRGCHVPHHHASGVGLVAGMAEGWYRFLGSSMHIAFGNKPPVSRGVTGIRDSDWERNPSATRHNTYAGATGAYVRNDYLHTKSIGHKCVGCHGNFHETMKSGNAWIRHPNDVVIPNSGEFTGLTTYNPLVPVARQNVAAGDQNFSNITRGSDVVSCISCHRAHGSPYPAMMRWGYQHWPGTDPHTNQPAFNGCAVCHTSKD